MACRKEALKNDVRSKNAATLSAAVSDALLFATMCIIGFPVEVHIKDGSVYSGIFHTASVDNDYAIVLKKARLIKKGNKQANAWSGNLIETLIVTPEDFVQVIAKEIVLGANSSTRLEEGKVIEADAGHEECKVENVSQLAMSRGNTNARSWTSVSISQESSCPCRSIAKTVNISHNSLEEQSGRSKQTHDACILSIDGRSVENGLLDIKSDSRNNLEIQDEKMDHEIQGSSETSSSTATSEEANMEELSKDISSTICHIDDVQNLKRSMSDGTACTAASVLNISVASIPSVDFESRLSASSAAFVPAVPSKTSNVKRTTKASKLNPGAKIFSPAMLHNKSVVPNTVSIGAGLPYITDSYNMPVTATTHEVDAGSFFDSSIPVKFSPYNVNIGNGNNDASYFQPIVGQVINRSQPVRYASQFQPGPCHVRSYPQNVMLGRVGPLVCVHPIPNDIIQTGTGLSQAAPWSLLTPHQTHLPKHQGNASAQAMQLCMSTPPIMANGPQQFVIPNTIPISQPLFPALRTVAIPRSNSYFSSKFA